jgi:hypothetical protein
MDYLRNFPMPAPLNHDQSIVGAAVIEELATLQGVWTGRIRAPGQKKKNNDGFTICHTPFIRTLSPLLDLPLTAYARPAQIALILNSYWTGIAKILPEPFDSTSNPQDYTIQKYHGTAVLHNVLPQAIQIIPAWGRSLDDPIAYADAMHDLPTLTNDTLTGRHVTPRSHSSFWRSGPDGAAAQYTGATGRKKLSTTIRTLIPQPPEGLGI